MGYYQELWHNQPNTFVAGGLALLVLLGLYIKLLDIYQWIAGHASCKVKQGVAYDHVNH